ncbi:MAG TPA: hypothetical protein VG994_04470 [Steroidobacteraceae bacterium]|nr:hypothetical protein [Steroidobacteraceae bacterium]
MPISPQRSRSWTAGITAALGLCMVATALADDAAPQAATAAQAAAARPAPSATTPPAANAPAPKVICFQSSIRCFTANPSQSAALDLRAPPITRVFSEAELQQKLEEPDEIHEAPTVQVEGERPTTPVSVGILAIPWAIVHPTQAWRIFAPVPEAK